MRYYLLSMLSGCMWAVIAFLLSLDFNFVIVGGLIASPLIGLLIGLIHRRAYNLPTVGQVLLSLGTLYLAVFLFGLAIGVSDLLWGDISNRVTVEVILGTAFTLVLGITISGYVLLLWPMAFLNHKLLESAATPPNNSLNRSANSGAFIKNLD
jgi:hypothetical protein